MRSRSGTAGTWYRPESTRLVFQDRYPVDQVVEVQRNRLARLAGAGRVVLVGFDHVRCLLVVTVGRIETAAQCRQVGDVTRGHQVGLGEIERVVHHVLADVLLDRFLLTFVVRLIADDLVNRVVGIIVRFRCQRVAQTLGLLVGKQCPGALGAVGLGVGLQLQHRPRGIDIAVQQTAVGSNADQLVHTSCVGETEPALVVRGAGHHVKEGVRP